MFTLSLMCPRTFFSTAAGGGVHGKDNGIARGAMMPVGATIEVVHLFIEAYPPIGGTITGRIVGAGVNGSNKEFPTIKFNKTGEHGKKISTGRNKIIGVSEVRISPKNNHNNRLEKFSSHNSETMKEEESRKT
jgi:hypothetical protein